MRPKIAAVEICERREGAQQLHEYALRYFLLYYPNTQANRVSIAPSRPTTCVSATEIEWPIDGDPRLHDKPSVLEKAEPHLQARVESTVVRASGRIRSRTRPPTCTTTLKHSLPFLTTASTSHSSKLSGNHYNHSKPHLLHSLPDHVQQHQTSRYPAKTSTW